VYFNRYIDNGIDYNSITRKYFNYIQQTVGGIEYELTWKPLEKLQVSGNYTLLLPEETTQNRLTNKDTVTYDYLLRRPKHALNMNIGLQATKALFVSLTGKYISSRYDVGGYAKRDVLLANYFIVGAYTEYKLNEKTRFFADAQNIGNKQFFDVRGFNSIPFLVNAGVSFKW
jgi:vitamin B12 transporter